MKKRRTPAEAVKVRPHIYLKPTGHTPKDPTISEMWVEESLGEWIVACRMVPEKGRPVVAELRIFPAEKALRDPGRWSGKRAPIGGMPQELLSRVQLSKARRALPRVLAQDKSGLFEHVLGEMDLGTFANVPQRPGRAGRDDRFYAELARGYVEQLNKGSSKPIADLREALKRGNRHYAPESVRQMVNEARSRKLLTAAPKGRAGGSLTDKAKKLLEGPKPRQKQRTAKKGRAKK